MEMWRVGGYICLSENSFLNEHFVFEMSMSRLWYDIVCFGKTLTILLLLILPKRPRTNENYPHIYLMDHALS